MASVILLCGKIACGKTTYAEQLQKEENTVLLSCDDLMLTLFDHCLGSEHDEMMKRCLDYLNHMAVQLVQKGITVVFDAGYWTVQGRKEAKQYFQEREIPVRLYYLTCEESLRLKRLRSRNRQLQAQKSPHRVYIIEERTRCVLDAKFEPPTSDEYDSLVDMTEWK